MIVQNGTIREAVERWAEWLTADGAFPDPEYDLFFASMLRLAIESGVGTERVKEIIIAQNNKR